MTLTGIEIEGFFIDKQTGKPTSHIPGTDQPIFEALKNTPGLPDGVLSLEEVLFHAEIKNPQPESDMFSARAKIIEYVEVLRAKLYSLGLDIEFSGVPSRNFEISPEILTPNASRLIIEKGWTFDDMRNTVTAGFQVNRSIPKEVIQANQQLSYVRELYNFWNQHFQAFQQLNSSSQRVDTVISLLSSGDQDIFSPDQISQSYLPGPFQTNQEMFKYFYLKSRCSESNPNLTAKGLHAVTLKPKGPACHWENFIPEYAEYRLFDSIEPESEKFLIILQLIQQIEIYITSLVLTSQQPHPQISFL